MSMLGNYFKVAVRNLLRHKVYSAINIAGLAIGIACTIVILLLLRYELTFDRFHSKADRIYRLYIRGMSEGARSSMTFTPGQAGPAMKADFPEVADYVRIRVATWSGYHLKYQDKRLSFGKVYFVDPSFFDIFDFQLMAGDGKTALSKPHTAVLTEEVAHRIFEDEEPIGKIFQDENKNEYQVTGILRNVPKNSHLQFDILLSIKEMVIQPNHEINDWSSANFFNYVLLERGANAKRLEEKFPAFCKKYLNNVPFSFEFHLQPLPDVHLYSSHFVLDSINYHKSDISYVYLIFLLAFIVLLIACFNFINLSTARSSGRAKEVGIRNVIGAQRGHLIKQFLGESVLLSFFALLIAVALIELTLPALNVFFGGALVFNYLKDWYLLAGLIGIIFCVGLIAGSYPAFFLSAFHPVTVLKGALSAGTRGAVLRKILVVAQFAASIVLVISTIIVVKQLQYLQNKNPGFNTDHVLTIPLANEHLHQLYKTMRQDLLQNPSITGVTVSLERLGQREIFSSLTTNFEGNGLKDKFIVSRLEADYDFIPFYGLSIVEGRAFSPDLAADASGHSGYIINETLARKLGWSSVQGKWIGDGPEMMHPVIGIVKDFNYMSLHSAIEPLRISIIDDAPFSCMSIRVRPENISRTLDFLKAKWTAYAPDQPFEYSFLDEDLAGLYSAEEREAKVISTFALLAIIVACLGLLGLISFSTESRTKEIGIRKVLGASVKDIVLLLSKEFIWLLCLAILVAWPVAWYVMDRWLQNFAYRIDLGWATFLLGGVIALVIVALTVSYQAMKAATANPVDALRYE